MNVQDSRRDRRHFFRFSIITLGRSKSKCSWQNFYSVNLAVVLKSFAKNMLMTKSSDRRSDVRYLHHIHLKKTV